MCSHGCLYTTWHADAAFAWKVLLLILGRCAEDAPFLAGGASVVLPCPLCTLWAAFGLALQPFKSAGHSEMCLLHPGMLTVMVVED